MDPHGPEGNLPMSTRVRLPDGNYVNVPTDDPQQAAAAARAYLANQEKAAERQNVRASLPTLLQVAGHS